MIGSAYYRQYKSLNTIGWTKWKRKYCAFSMYRYWCPNYFQLVLTVIIDPFICVALRTRTGV